MNPSNVNRKVAEEIEPRRYQANASLSQPPTTGADRPVREYVTNVKGHANVPFITDKRLDGMFGRRATLISFVN